MSPFVPEIATTNLTRLSAADVSVVVDLGIVVVIGVFLLGAACALALVVLERVWSCSCELAGAVSDARDRIVDFVRQTRSGTDTSTNYATDADTDTDADAGPRRKKKRKKRSSHARSDSADPTDADAEDDSTDRAWLRHRDPQC